ncbi:MULTISPECIES: MFS transporter [Carnobacterium]|jgi:EmrB/QacA subfamily drug resistance transporter|uniref:Drug resistance MFS transporter, drug:H+ antiporter-1 family protein n=2 Tax=Carnobacterium maltaromaticum TaxID=2751 RepID=K8E357_CARML|nr:MFS transporter [Carnobacterium maltaromaticum]AOA01522.1 multidrug MFS transporter [Carnobacterium maltaromaticum]KRN60661.1 drug H(+) antiporter [Carnobacterium maltaromaticum DSM 20342]KRN71631.1 drug H(+) antiporter [Carnobacterium maltaromaticum]KRN84273.1 drug H(+) antiporter [Carnobacterium maltaromaticum]MBC9789483.1 DHA2 family efflux MFS transporter permease subunit [Carnobacterium maltaromaticum]
MGNVIQSYQMDPKVQKNRWLILVAVGLFTFMSTLDGSIVNIAIPVISERLGVPMNQSEWIVSVYLMTVCILILLFGKIGDLIGKIKVFRWGTFIFVLGSLLCGIEINLGFLLVARIIQAIGASMTMSANYGIITEIFPIKERGKALGLMGSFVSLGSIAGPGIGGILLAHFDWSSIFLINVPVGLITIFMGMKILPKDLFLKEEKIDYAGFLAFALFIGTLFIGIFIGQEIGFLHGIVIGMFSIAVISFIAFIRIENKVEKPLVHFGLFKNSLFSISLLCAFLIFVTNFFFNVMMPFYLQGTLSLPPSQAGLLLMVFPMVMVIAAPISGSLSDKIGAEILTFIGLAVLTLVQLAYIFIGVDTNLIWFAVLTGLMGLGSALFQSPNNAIVMSSVPKDQLGIAGSMNSLARNLGMVFGISFATTILYWAMSSKAGFKVTTYLADQPQLFVYGMHVTFTVSFAICLFATCLTGYRLLKK